MTTKRDLHTGKHDQDQIHDSDRQDDEAPERSDSSETPSGQTTPTLHGSVSPVQEQEASAAMIMGKTDERGSSESGEPR